MKNVLSNLSLLGLVFAISLLVSCEKEIKLGLKDAATQYVLESYFDDSLGFEIRITQSKAYYENNTFSEISTAIVTLSDNVGNTTIIQHDSAGFYRNTSLLAVSGRTYTLTVSDQGNTFEATSTVPNPTEIDKITVQNFSFGGGEPFKVLKVWYQDAPGLGNCYMSILTNEKTPDSGDGLFLQDDRLSDGILNTMNLFGGDIAIGDTVHVGLRSIDKPSYDYFNTLDQLSGGGPGGGITPSNPTSNWSNNALGIFAAYSLRGKYYVVTP